jgi:hypothetical protein
MTDTTEATVLAQQEDDTTDLAGMYQAMYFEQAGTIKMQVKMLTPAYAAEVLAKNNNRNRKMKPVTVRVLSEDITEGRWSLNGEPIVFDTHGTLIDGQHRLAAIVAAGLAVPVVVITGVKPAAFESHGQARPRTRADILSIAPEGQSQGEQNTVCLAAALGWVWRWENSLIKSIGISPRNTEIRDILDRHPLIRESVKSVAGRCQKGIHNPSIMSFLHYLFGCKDAAARDVFFNQLLDGFGVEPNTHMALLVRWLKNNTGSLNHSEYPGVAAVIIKTWNRIRTGAKVNNTLVWKPGEAFPEIV